MAATATVGIELFCPVHRKTDPDSRIVELLRFKNRGHTAGSAETLITGLTFCADDHDRWILAAASVLPTDQAVRASGRPTIRDTRLTHGGDLTPLMFLAPLTVPAAGVADVVPKPDLFDETSIREWVDRADLI